VVGGFRTLPSLAVGVGLVRATARLLDQRVGGLVDGRPDRRAALWHWSVVHNPGNEIVNVDGDKAFRHGGEPSGSLLGYWRDQEIPWSWAAWVRVETSGGTWSPMVNGRAFTNDLVIASASNQQTFTWRLGFRQGRPFAFLIAGVSGGDHLMTTTRNLVGRQVAPPGQWMHLAFTSDGTLARLFVNGQIAAEERAKNHSSPLLAAFSLSGSFDVQDEPRLINQPVHVEHDDIVLWDRVVTPEEMRALASHGRGGWWREVRRAESAAAIGHKGARALTVCLLVLGLSTGANWLLRRVEMFATELPRASFRPVLLVLVIGTVLTVGGALAVATRGKAVDRACSKAQGAERGCPPRRSFLALPPRHRPANWRSAPDNP